MKTIYEIRKAGREYCQTEGSEHYKAVDKLEPIDLIIAKGLAEDFCLANIIKYAARFKQTQKLDDLKKISDYSHILVGVKLGDAKQELKETGLKRVKCADGYCSNSFIKTIGHMEDCRHATKINYPNKLGVCEWLTDEEKGVIPR